MLWSWFKQVLAREKEETYNNKYDFVAIDFETANNDKSSICSCGIVVVKDGEIQQKKHFLIRPKVLKFNKRNTEIHGLSIKDVEDKPTFDKLWPEIKEFIDQELVVAHNASFDLTALKAVLDSYHLDYPNIDYLCTVHLAKKTVKEVPNHKLNTLAKHFDIPLNHHDALSDAAACAHLVNKICGESNLREVISQNDIKLRKISAKLAQ
ncbi:3'-5' exonuclease [Candidatus Uabimicrobium amorphum]|uniref:DNA polymerase III subunit epsilon n=1 Tax=Uabimicrobium amorphum TaxID=2596890 RepID=A0A5S9F731_UABAM|nr:3'-5' exonuclease [Candidatus Uabimicrobium amorphum]BBM87214.1 DNA polymerase III subunit epsilon [Candidatus Uabimicrobium amorphum]